MIEVESLGEQTKPTTFRQEQRRTVECPLVDRDQRLSQTVFEGVVTRE